MTLFERKPARRTVSFTRLEPEAQKHPELWGEENELHCANCGQSPIWLEQGEGDYFTGPLHICTHCAYSYYVSSLRPIKHGYTADRLRTILTYLERERTGARES